MKLSYTGLDDRRHGISARITRDHSVSSHGIPVVVLSDGDTLDYNSAILLNYQLVEAGPREAKLLDEWRRAMSAMISRE